MASQYVSFDEVKARVSMEQLLERYDLLNDQAKRRGDELALHCVFHANDKTPSLKINTAKNIFNCFGCNSGGDVIGFVVLREGIATGDHDRDRREAALLLQEWFALDGKRSKKSPRRRSTRASAARTAAAKETPATDDLPVSEAPEPAREGEEAAPANRPLSFTLQNLDPRHPYLKERGLTDETIETFGLGYFGGKGSLHGRIAIPIHDGEGGHILAYAGRWPGDPPEGEPKYKLPANFHKSFVLYNFHRAREHASDGLIVVEGFFTVFELSQKGRRNVVAVMGNHVSPEQEQLIAATVGPKGRVLIAFDDDEAGRQGAAEAAVRLAPQVFVRTVALF